MKHSLYPSLSVFALLLGTLTMVGCGGAASFSNPKATDPPPPSAPQVVAGPAIKGSVYGGHAPLGGAHVYLLQPGTTGYGSAATSLLGSGTTTSPGGYTLTANVNDPNVPGGAMYETTDSGGGFNFTGAYSCTVGQPVYVYAWGGNIGGGALNNESIVQLATLGNCPSSGNFSTAGNGAISYIYLNEVSTVATAYTFQPYTSITNTSAWNIGSTNTTQGLLGIANAANTAAQLYNIEGGTQISSTQQGEGHLANYQTLLNGVPNDGNGVVPQATIDTLANILSDCVDSTVVAVGTTTATCNTLFADARDNGETTGTEPVDTATAMINIARFPAGNNSDTTAADNVPGKLGIYVLQPATLPYVPALTAAPNDWTIAINYPGPNNGVAGSANSGKVTNSTLNLAESIAVDKIGQIWITSQGLPATGGGYTDNPDIVRWSNLGQQNALNTYTYIPGYVSVDGTGNAWTGNANDSPSGTGGGGTGIFYNGSNGVFTTSYGSGYYDAYVVITNNAGDAFFFASNATLTPNYDMWEYNGSGTLSAASPININGTSTTTTGTGTLTITNATVAETCTGFGCGFGGGTTTYTYTFTATNPGSPAGATALAAGQTVDLTLTNRAGGGGTGAGTNWTRLNGNQTVATASGTQFTVTSTTNLNITNRGQGTGTYTYSITTTTPGAVPAGQNVAHGAIDSEGDLWITTEADPSGGTSCNNGCEIARISPTGTPLFTSLVTAEQPEFPAIDASNNAWIAVQETASDIYVVSPAGGTTILTPTGGGGSTATGALMASTFGAAVDGNGNVWFANRCGNYGACGTAAGENTIFVLNGGVSTPGTIYNAISPPTNYVPEAEYAGATSYTKILDGSLNLAIDPSGDVWITNYTGGGVVELVGAAAPVVTPLSVAAGNGQLGQKP